MTKLVLTFVLVLPPCFAEDSEIMINVKNYSDVFAQKTYLGILFDEFRTIHLSGVPENDIEISEYNEKLRQRFDVSMKLEVAFDHYVSLLKDRHDLDLETDADVAFAISDALTILAHTKTESFSFDKAAALYAQLEQLHQNTSLIIDTWNGLASVYAYQRSHDKEMYCLNNAINHSLFMKIGDIDSIKKHVDLKRRRAILYYKMWEAGTVDINVPVMEFEQLFDEMTQLGYAGRSYEKTVDLYLSLMEEGESPVMDHVKLADLIEFSTKNPLEPVNRIDATETRGQLDAVEGPLIFANLANSSLWGGQ